VYFRSLAMHVELEDFLESAFDPIQPSSSKIGRVVVEPDYDVQPDPSCASHIAQQLSDCIRNQPLTGDRLAARNGLEATIGPEYDLLRKYLRRITLFADPLEGPWVEVAPPGNWI
jgi:hypothetical protein